MRIGRPNTTPSRPGSVSPVRRRSAIGAVAVVAAVIAVAVVVHAHQTGSPTAATGLTTRTSVSVPAGARTPKDLYGRWVPRSWTDGAGSHDVHAPSDRDITVRFEERNLGPVIVYEADCAGTAIANVTYDDGAITFDPNAQTSELGTCPDAWHLPVLRSLFGPNGHLRYQLAGNTLTVENVSARVTVIATRER